MSYYILILEQFKGLMAAKDQIILVVHGSLALP